MEENRKNIEGSTKLINESIVSDAVKKILNIKYGSITFTVHNSKIVQVEATEKKRYDDAWLLEKGGGI